MVSFKFMVYVPSTKIYEPIESLKKETKFKTISGTENEIYPR